MINEIIKAIEGTELWIKLNESAKQLYIQEKRNPSEEEYKAVRNMIILKVMLEDENIKNMVSEMTYNELRKV